MRIPVIPEFYSNLPNSTRLKSKEVIPMFGYKNTSDMTNFISCGLIPEPKFVVNGSSSINFTGSLRGKCFYWTLGSIRRLRIKMLKEIDK